MLNQIFYSRLLKTMKLLLKLILIFLFFNTVCLKSQIIKGYGFKLGGNISYQNASYNDALLNLYYKEKPGIRFYFNASGFLEFFKHKFFSTIAELSLTGRGANFDYEMKNENGNVIGIQHVHNSFTLVSLSLNPKLRYQMKKNAVYIFGGPRVDFILGKNIDVDFESTYQNSNHEVIGYNAGIGLILNGFLVELEYQGDITNSISSDAGNIKNIAFLLQIGLNFRF
jgi:hypothetical protein